MLSVLKFVIYYPTIVATVLFLLWMALRYVWHSIRLLFVGPAEIERVTGEFLARHMGREPRKSPQLKKNTLGATSTNTG